MKLRSLLILATILMLPACAEMELASHVVKQTPIAESDHKAGRFKVGSSYKIAGARYTPRETYSFEQTGVASWYGPNFHGKMTANGEIFDKYALTAAHKTLQMPSIARVTNLENGRSIVVRINDRGPFSKGRVIDLSERSAEVLGFKNQGTARVKIQVLPEESRRVAALAKQGKSTRGIEVAMNQKGYSLSPQPVDNVPTPLTRPTQIAHNNHVYAPVSQTTIPTAKPQALFVQAGSFKTAAKAQELASQIQNIGPSRINPTLVNGSKYYRVQVGPIANKSQADLIVSQLSSANIGEPFLIRD